MISITRARSIARQLADKGLGVYPALESFAETGSVDPGLVRNIRDAESKIAQWLRARLIDSALYFGVVELERFANDHLDDQFARLKQYHERLIRRTRQNSATGSASATV